MIIFDCEFGDPHTHEYPDDWIFGGPGGTSPAADPRFQVTHYRYHDARLKVVYQTGAIDCDEEALDGFTMLNFNPVFISVKRPGDKDYQFMNWIYVAETDTLHPYWKEGQGEKV